MAGMDGEDFNFRFLYFFFLSFLYLFLFSNLDIPFFSHILFTVVKKALGM
jgi:hypothetical protein